MWRWGRSVMPGTAKTEWGRETREWNRDASRGRWKAKNSKAKLLRREPVRAWLEGLARPTHGGLAHGGGGLE